ncbi:glycoside hydrolase family 26 protein [Streptomyces sp. NBC_00887]|uniref:glycoside hydrolase family 26 protein n=1 Tax=Streptomyces sp. NBC_00887 TaxID=2975859 RepID=UPI00386F8138|nr:glycosyl hydrolase [Streptomyces sp. NBC_00887]WSY35929.1 glycosyl hydrolase [Streptomyces sp. NBC_00887]
MPAQRRLINFCIGTAVLGLLVGGAVVTERTESDSKAAKGASPAPAASADTTAIGAYLNYGPDGIRRMAELSRWLGGTDLRVGHSYLPGDRWENIEGRPGFLAAWGAWRRASEDRMFVLNTPMLERNEARVPDSEVRRLLRAGARGEFDEHFRRLADRLVLLGIPDTVIVLGWEMNGTTYTHRCGPDPVAWKAYWSRIVTTMRSVPGQKFRFDFAPSRGRDAVPWTECYPGDDVVDIIGMDTYDQPPARTFDEQVNEPYGLQKQVDFAAERGKPISFPEWGLFRNGDNPEYMRRMLKWFEQHKPVYQTITDYCPHGVWQCAANPESSRVYREMLNQEPGTADPTSPVPMPSGTPKPDKPTPIVPAPDTNGSDWCISVPLSDWFSQWMTDRKFCLGD